MNNNFSSIRLEVTSKCNINCKYCHKSDYANKVDDMTTTEIETLIKSLKEQYPINKVLLTGGEPLLNKDIVKLVRTLTNMDIKVDMVTNGKLLNEELIQKLYNAGLKRIRLSIDGFEEHTEYRKGSDPYRLWELCKYIKNNTNMNLVVHTVCSPHNVDALERIYDKIIELGVDRWRVFDIGYSGEAVNNIELFGIAGYYEKFIENVAVILEKYISQNLKEKLDIEINGVFKTNLLENIYDEFKDATPEQLLDSMLSVSPCDYINHQMTIRNNGKCGFCDRIYSGINYSY